MQKNAKIPDILNKFSQIFGKAQLDESTIIRILRLIFPHPVGMSNVEINENIDKFISIITQSLNIIDVMKKLTSQYGGNIETIKRHVYALERLADNKDDQIMIGIQRTATSIQKEYIKFTTSLEINITIYLEPLQGGFSIFVISSMYDARVLDFLRHLLLYLIAYINLSSQKRALFKFFVLVGTKKACNDE